MVSQGTFIEIGEDGAFLFGAFRGGHGIDAVGSEDDGGAIAECCGVANDDFIAGHGNHRAGGDCFVFYIGDDVDISLPFDEAGDFEAGGEEAAVGVDVEDDDFGVEFFCVFKSSEELIAVVFVDFAGEGDDDGFAIGCGGAGGRAVGCASRGARKGDGTYDRQQDCAGFHIRIVCPPKAFAQKSRLSGF